jgi:hypothetical protein
MRKLIFILLFIPFTVFGQDKSVKVILRGDSIIFARNDEVIGKIGGLTSILQNMGGIPGPAGIQGMPGAKGDRGDTGLQGPPGSQGERGYQGLPGADGAQGLQGLPGSQGMPGNDGSPGAKGDKGDPGNPGSTGVSGYTPIKGVDYFDGAQGTQGIQGNPGTQGLQGIQGPAGSDATVTKTAVEAVLTGTISTHTHSGGVDPFTAKLYLAADKPTGANVTPVTLGLSFAYEANSRYAINIYAIVAPTAATTGCGFLIDVSSVVTYVGTFVSHQLAITGTLSGAASIGDLAVTSSGVSSGMVSTASQFVPGSGILVTGANTGTATFFFRSETTAVTTCKTGTLITVMKI